MGTQTVGHTPGPWEHDQSTPTNPRIFGADGSVVVDLTGAMSGCDTQADARLIAAAPDLLAACKTQRALLQAIREGYPDIALDTRVDAVCDRADDAIVLAEGGRPSAGPDTASMDTEACVEWLRSNADANHGWLAEAMDSDPSDPIGWLRNQVRQEWYTRAEGGAA